MMGMMMHDTCVKVTGLMLLLAGIGIGLGMYVNVAGALIALVGLGQMAHGMGMCSNCAAEMKKMKR